MNDDPHKVDSTISDAVQEQPRSPSVDTVPPVQKPRGGNRALLITIVLIAIVLCGGYLAWVTMTPKKATYDTDSTAEKIPQFYLASDTKSVHVFDPTDRRSSSRAIRAGEKEQFSGRSAYANQFLQMSDDGGTVAYLTDEYNYDPPYPGDGVRGPTGHFLYAIKHSSEAKQIMDAARVSDWILSADGSMIYYLAQGEGDSSQDFHVRNLADSKDILVEKDIFSDSVGRKEAPMLLADDGSVRMYLTYESGIREYRYEATFVTSRRWTTTECQGCRIAYGSPLSPDGKSLVLVGIEKSGEASINILDLTNGKIKQIKRTERISEQFNDVYWSPDSASIVYSVGPYGSEAQNKVGFPNRFEIYNFKTKGVTSSFRDLSPGVDSSEYTKHTVGVLGWSPDGSVIAFYNGGQVKMYTLANNRVTDTGLAYDWWKGTPFAPGWYTVWRVTQKIK